MLLEQKYNVREQICCLLYWAIEGQWFRWRGGMCRTSHKGLPIQFIICGEDTEERKVYSIKIKRLDLENITLMDFTNRNGVSEVLNITDAALISYKPGPF